MLASVAQAQGQRGLAKKKVWERAAEVYRDGYVKNCAVPEEQRALIRAPTTAEMIHQSYIAMSANQRAFVADARSAGRGSQQSAAGGLQAGPHEVVRARFV